MPDRQTPSKPVVIGLIGGIAAGKSRVARLFGDLGAAVIDADDLARRAAERPDVQEAIRSRFGPQVFRDGALDRSALAARVFGDPAGRQDLEALIHPIVIAEVALEVDSARARGVPAIVLDVPLLMEAGMQGGADLLVFVDAPQDVRERRAREARGWTEGEVARREAHQIPLAEKRKLAAAEVPNGGSIEEARSAVRRIWSAFIETGSR